MVDAGLLVHGAPEAGAGDSDERPAALVVDYEGAAGVSQTGVLLARLVARTEHLRVQLDHDVLVLVPADALLVGYDGHEDLVQDVRAGLAERVISLAPACHEASPTWEGGRRRKDVMRGSKRGCMRHTR